jgi:tetratricopeptide (TPR) repeat protein/tRNA A-37 threonylcarbamoyl transferase component Bud32
MLGETIGRYRLTERLGSGAMGEVYLAEDTRLHRPVALKMLPKEAREDEAAAARLVREARLASSLTHPNIAVIYEIGEEETNGRRQGFIAMEYVPGRTLADVLAERRLDLVEILRIVRQVADALSEAHRGGVVHGDVKPANMMMTERGQVKLLDFGLARFRPPAGDETSTWSGPHRLLPPGAVMGTLAYMSPEQTRGASVDERSDVFSLGVVLYELLEGRLPFAGDNAVELLDAILHAAPPPLVRHEGPLAEELARVVLRMLEKSRERRHSDMTAVCRDLRALMAGRAAAPRASDAETPGIAVLSFANITRNHEDDWLGTGIAETVTAGLSEVAGLTVVSRARVVELLRKLGAPEENEEAFTQRLGRELGVKFVVSGGYQRLGAQVRVTARTIEVDTGAVFQTLKLDGSMVEIFELQDRILGELSAGLRLRLPAGAASGRDLYETHSLEAYEAFAKGLINLRAESPDALDRAILFFERSLALDPSYASAHLERGIAYDLKADYLSMPELYQRSLESFDRALELRPDFVEAHRSRGGVLLSLGREDEAVEAVERALALDPGAASAYQTLGRVYFIGCGDFARAAECYEKALALNPQAGWAALQLSHCAALLGDGARAEVAAWQAVVLQEEFLSGREGQLIVGAYVRLGQALALQGRFAEAVQQFERELEFLRRVDHALRSRIFIELHQRVGEARLRLGDAAGGRAALDFAIEAFERRLRTGADDSSTRYYAACAYALRGDVEAALDCLEKAAAGRRRLTVARARVESALAGLRSEPRFQALVEA